jgi:dTDP-glucose 4,6-dehydratase
LPVYGDGQQIRDWLYVKDHARGIELVLKKGRVGENYNIGGHNEWANINIVNLVCQLMNEAFTNQPKLATQYPQADKVIKQQSQGLIKYVTDRAGHDRRYAIDATKSALELGYKPVESFDSGIAKTIEWYLSNTQWWAPLLDSQNQIKLN